MVYNLAKPAGVQAGCRALHLVVYHDMQLGGLFGWHLVDCCGDTGGEKCHYLPYP